MLPDTGERYLSTPLFEDIPAEMTTEEIEISQSTPRYRFDGKSAARCPLHLWRRRLRNSTPEAEAFVDKVTTDTERPVVMFAHEWCEFCWSVRRAVQGIRHSLSLRRSRFRRLPKDDWAARSATCSKPSHRIPPRFRKSSSASATSAAAPRLRCFQRWTAADAAGEHGMSVKPTGDVNAYSFLPKWLQPR